MDTVKAYYNGSVFVPIVPLNIREGIIVQLSICQEDTTTNEASEKLEVFRRLTNEIHALNKTEPLTPEFDEVMSRRVNFTRGLDI